METLNAVKSEKKSIEILVNWLNENLTKDLLHCDTYIEDANAKCACGQTQGKMAYFEASNKMAIIAICDVCGED